MELKPIGFISQGVVICTLRKQLHLASRKDFEGSKPDRHPFQKGGIASLKGGYRTTHPGICLMIFAQQALILRPAAKA